MHRVVVFVSRFVLHYLRTGMSSRSRLVQAGLVLAVAMAAAPSSATADVVEVSNGDRITGDVRRLLRARLSFATSAAGTIEIAWREVVRLTSSVTLDVELDWGERYFGSIDSPAPGQLLVQTTSGPTAPFAMERVVRMTPVGATVRERTVGSIDFGLNFLEGGKDTNYALTGEAANRTRSYETELWFESWLSRRDGESRQTRNGATFDLRRLLPRRWYALGEFRARENEDLDLRFRAVAGGGVGRTLRQSNETQFALQGGLAYEGEWYGDEDEADHSPVAFAGVLWDWYPSHPTLDAMVDATTFVNLSRARVRLELASRLSRSAFGNTHWSLRVYESVDSDPPGDRPKSDLAVSIGLGWSF